MTANRSEDAAPTLAGKRVLITGASSGVGLAAARSFAADGARVALVSRRAEELAALAEEIGDAALDLPADVSDPARVAEVVAAADEAFGGLDVVVNSAGIGFPSPLEEVTPEVWREVIDINLSGSFYVAREAGLRMREAGSGRIVNVGSELSLVGAGIYVPYCASKFGVIGLTKAMAAELAPDVQVNVICPGPIETPMMEDELDWFPDPAATRAALLERLPMKRFASPEEVARAIAYLAVDAPYATGTVLSLDGGMTAV